MSEQALVYVVYVVWVVGTLLACWSATERWAS